MNTVSSLIGEPQKFEVHVSRTRTTIMPSDTGVVQNTTPEQVETKFNEFATIGKLVDRPELARVYVYICYYGPVIRPQIQSALTVPKTTVYDHVDTLADLGIVEVAGDRPAEVTLIRGESPPTLVVG